MHLDPLTVVRGSVLPSAPNHERQQVGPDLISTEEMSAKACSSDS
jgi:hypothetical protein